MKEDKRRILDNKHFLNVLDTFSGATGGKFLFLKAFMEQADSESQVLARVENAIHDLSFFIDLIDYRKRNNLELE